MVNRKAEINVADLEGTDFQIKVWKQLMKIPIGETRTYKEVAVAIDMPQAARAVANACAKNPFPPIIPCHRVVREDGGLGGYSANGGVEKKRQLLKIEALEVKE
ncbi:MAG: methylated-DNA--[protein]-cysteine S-methyltransferase [Pseudomonadota bacterium]|nr:methylated-DNA--[protein]-cysteine S-methyltransferase [Pseudomonadota bacterium]